MSRHTVTRIVIERPNARTRLYELANFIAFALLVTAVIIWCN